MLRFAIQLFAMVAMATLLAEGIGVGYLCATGSVDKVKMLQIMAIVHGVALPNNSGADARGAGRQEPSEQVSFEEIEKRRALEAHYLETKMMALEKGLREIRMERELLSIDLDQIKRLQTGFNKRLDTLQEQLTLEGIAQQRQIWSKIEPALAKAQIMNMVDAGEIDDVVVLLTDMPVATQAKIISEFQLDNPKERDAMDEILRKIRKGLPAVTLIEDARKELSAEKAKTR